MTHAQIIKYYEYPTGAARSLYVTLQTLRNWKLNGIPYPAQQRIEAMSGGALKADKRKERK